MVLPIYITKNWLSTSLVETEPFKVVQTAFVKYPYVASKFDNSLTSKKLHDLLIQTDQNFDTKKHRPIYISDKEHINDIKADVLMKNLIGKYHLVPIFLDHYNSDVSEFLSPAELNEYENKIYYKFNISPETKIALDKSLFMKQIKGMTKELIDTEEIIIMTYDVSSKDIDIYIEEITQAFSNQIKIAGIWAFSLDVSFSFIPMLGAIKFLEMDVKDVFKKDSLHTDTKLIIAPGVKEIEILKTKSKKYKASKLKPEAFNHIMLAEKESIKIQWKTKNSRFSGEIFGSTLGILIDNRQLDRKG